MSQANIEALQFLEGKMKRVRLSKADAQHQEMLEQAQAFKDLPPGQKYQNKVVDGFILFLEGRHLSTYSQG